ncbi:MAG: InlB B-repeat-containing protein [Firmicutes bacterium]|nr:InlB B-repeat-containing protein [Bacillota bacterium]
MMFSAMGTSGYSVFADESLPETEEEVVAVEAEAVDPEVTEDVQGPSPGDDEISMPAEDADETEALSEEDAEEAAEPAEEEPGEIDEEAAEEANEEISEEPSEEDVEPAEEAEEAQEPEEAAEEAAQTEEGEEEAEEAAEEQAEEPTGSIVEEFVKVSEAEPVEEPVEEPAEEAEIAYPKKTFRDFIGGMSVTVAAPEGAFPEGTEMKLAEVEIESIIDAVSDAVDGNIANIKAVDITFFYNGKEIQPLKPINVKMNASGMDADSDRQVLHIDDEGEATVVEDADTSKKTVEFAADSFSVYVVVETVVPRLTVTFKEGETVRATMIVKKDDTDEIAQIIYDPGVASIPTGQVFKGWTADGDTTVLTIDAVRTDALARAANLTNADGAVTYTAAFYKQYKITYLNSARITVGSDIAETPGNLSEAEYTVNMGFSTDDEHLFEGWMVAEGSSNIKDYPEGTLTETINGEEVKYYPNNTKITVTGDVTFSVTAPEGHWLVFDANGKGATYNAPRFIKSGERTSAEGLLDMHRKGYSFDGWYTVAPSEVGGIPTGDVYEFGETLTNAKTIYAKWTPNESAEYTIIVWKQNYDSIGHETLNKQTDYDFAASYVGTGDVGASIKNEEIVIGTEGELRYVTIDEEQVFGGIKSVANGAVSDPLTGFTLSPGAIDDVAINAEGNAVLNLYFDRMQYTLKLYVTRTNNTGTGQYRGSNVAGDVFAGDWATTLNSITTIFGSAPSTYDSEGGYRYYYYPITAYYGQKIDWPTYANINSSTAFVSWLVMHSAKAYRGQGNGRDTLKGVINVMDEQILGDLSQSGGNYVTARYGGSSTWHYYIFFADANGNYPDVDHPSKDIEVHSNQTGDGSQTAPTYDGYDYVPSLDVYSRTPLYMRYYYTPSKYSILYMDGAYFDGNGNKVKEESIGEIRLAQGISYGADISSYKSYKPDADHTPEGYVFEGWYTDEACNDEYAFETMPQGGITVYAKWRQIEYRVFLHPKAGHDTTLSWGDESATTKQEMSFRIPYGGKVSLPDGYRKGYEFYGWYTDDGLDHAYAPETVLNDQTVTTEYDKSKSTELNKWGEVESNENKDLDRPWITRELDLYAKWSEVTVGAKGIGVLYDAGEGTDAPSDTALYKDNAKVGAGAAATAPANKMFDHWVLQTWNGTKYVDTETEVYPGQSFTILKKDAKITDAETGALVAPGAVQDDGKYNYTVQLRAEYVPFGTEVKTHIYWYSNFGTDNDGKGIRYREDTNIKINEGVSILAAQTRAGYDFKGWTKTKGGTTADFLIWTGSGYTDASGNTATQVAADERQNSGSYDDLYAVWAEATVKIEYKVAEGQTAMGSVSPASEEISAINDTAEGSTATPASEAYVFDYWSVDDKAASISTNAKYVPQKVNGAYEAHTYCAHFKATVEVTVHHYLKGTEIQVATDVTERVPEGASYTASPVTTYQEKPLTVASYDPSQTITVSASAHEITVYYTLPLLIAANTASKIYDGAPLDGGYTITGALSSDEETAIRNKLPAAPSITNVAESEKKYLTETEQAAITGIPEYYAVEFVSGTLSIAKRPVTFTGETASKTYTGKEIELTAVTPSSGENEGLVDGHTFTVAYSAKGKEMGNYPGTIAEAKDVIIKDASGEVVTGNYKIETVPGTLKIVGEGYVSITKEVTSTPKEGDAYGLGEVIEYKITAKNEGETVTLYNVVVADEMTDQTWTIPVLGPGEAKDFIPNSHTVTEDDIKAGKVINKAVIKSGTPDNPNTPDTPENPDIPFTPDPPIIIDVPTEDPNPHLTITKVVTSTPAKDGKYALGETINYKITVTNDGNLTITDINVIDKLEGVVLDEPEDWTIESLAPDASVELTASYTVTEADILAGKVKNEAVGQFLDPREPVDPPTTPDDPPTTPEDPPVINVPTEEPPEVLTETPKAYLVITKVTTSSPEDEKYKLGEELTYTITVKNEGNVTVTNITVTDAKTKDTWEIGDLAPGEELEAPLFTGYMVGEEDVIQGKVINEATATGTVPEGVELTVKKGHTEDDVATPVGKTIKVIFYTNYPSDATRSNDRVPMENAYSDLKAVEIPYRLPGFVVAFNNNNDLLPINYDFTGWELHRPNKTQNVDEGDTISDAGTSSIASASSSSEATDPTEGADYIFYAQWEDNGYVFPTHGAVIIDKPDPDPDDPDPDDEPDPDDQIDDEPTPLSPFEEIPDEDIEEPDTPYAGWEEEPDEEISEEPTPLSPYTGDDRHTAAWGFVSLMSLAGIAVLGRKRREEE